MPENYISHAGDGDVDIVVAFAPANAIVSPTVALAIANAFVNDVDVVDVVDDGVALATVDDCVVYAHANDVAALTAVLLVLAPLLILLMVLSISLLSMLILSLVKLLSMPLSLQRLG